MIWNKSELSDFKKSGMHENPVFEPEVQNLPEKWKISPYDKNIFKKCPPREKCFLQGKLFSLERKKNFSKISPRYINFQNFPRTAVRARG